MIIKQFESNSFETYFYIIFALKNATYVDKDKLHYNLKALLPPLINELKKQGSYTQIHLRAVL